MVSTSYKALIRTTDVHWLQHKHYGHSIYLSIPNVNKQEILKLLKDDISKNKNIQTIALAS